MFWHELCRPTKTWISFGMVDQLAYCLLPGPSRRLAPVIKCSPFLSFVFSTLHCEGYIADFRYRWPITSWSARWLIKILSAILKSMRTIGFWETTRSPAFTMHKFMSENLIVNIWRDNFTSDFLRVNLPSRNLSRTRRISA